MGLFDWLTSASSNTAVDGVGVQEGMQGRAVNNAIRGLMSVVAKYRNDTSGKLTTGGTANTYTVALESAPTALADGMMFSAIIHVTNTGASTITPNSGVIAAKAIHYKAAALAGGELVAGQVYRFSYDSSAASGAGAWLLENPSPVAASLPSYTSNDIGDDSNYGAASVTAALNTIKANADALTAGASATHNTFAEIEAVIGAIDTAKAPLASPALTGTPTAPTQDASDNSTKLATTAYVDTALTGVGGGLVFIASIDASNDTTVEFTGFDPSSYDGYVFIFQNLTPATDAVYLYCRLSDDGGTTYESGASYYMWCSHVFTSNGLTASSGDIGDPQISLNGSNTEARIGSAANEDGISGHALLAGAGLTKSITMTGQISYIDHDGIVEGANFVGGLAPGNAGPVNGIQFFFSSGNIESGTITMYGMVNA